MAVNPKLKDEETDHLFRAILQLRNMDECYMFFEDLCTITELKALAQGLPLPVCLRRERPTVRSWRLPEQVPPP